MTTPMPPGWYPAEGDPPGTQRYWDGGQWQGGPQAVPAAPLGFSSPGFPPSAAQYPESSNAITALVVSLGGFILCGVLFPIGWWLGSQEVKAIDAGRRDPSNRGTARAAELIGMIMTIIAVLSIIGVVLLITIGTASS